MFEYLIFCKCINEITKLKDCSDCPHKAKDTEEFKCLYEIEDK